MNKAMRNGMYHLVNDGHPGPGYDTLVAHLMIVQDTPRDLKRFLHTLDRLGYHWQRHGLSELLPKTQGLTSIMNLEMLPLDGFQTLKLLKYERQLTGPKVLLIKHHG